MEPGEEYSLGMPMPRTFSASEGFDGDGGDEGGVDASAKADEGFVEAAFADIVTGAEDEGVPAAAMSSERGRGDRGAWAGIDEDEVFGEGSCLGDDSPVH